MALARKWIPSPNYSSRGGTKVRIVCIHTAEGARTIESLGSFFQNPSSGVSSQTGIDDQPGVIGEYVKRDMKSWATGNANPYVTSVELCAFAKWDRAEWLRHPVMLENCRQWIAEESAYFGIPRVRITAAQAGAGAAGVCGHVDLSGPGGHWDPGPNFPYDIVLQGGPATIPPTPPTLFYAFGNGGQEDGPMAQATHPNGKRLDICVIGSDRAVWHYWTNDQADLARMSKESLGGQGRAVSCSWLDAGRFVVTVTGTDNGVHRNQHDGKKWSGWAKLPDMVVHSG